MSQSSGSAAHCERLASMGKKTIKAAIDALNVTPGNYIIDYIPTLDGFEIWITNPQQVTFVSEFIAIGVGRGR